MSKKATDFQKEAMGAFYRGKEIFMPLNTGWIDENVACVKSLTELEEKLRSRPLKPIILTGHTGWTDNFEFAFAHRDKLCSVYKKKAHDPNAPYDAYDESDDTEQNAKSENLSSVG